MNSDQNTMTQLIRVNIDMERAIVGTLLTVQNSMLNICDGFSDAMFYDNFCADVFRTIKKLDDEGKKIDPIIVSERMKRDGIAFDISELLGLTNNYTYDLLPYTMAVKERAIERGVLAMIQEVRMRIEANEDIGDVLYSFTEKAAQLQESLVGLSDSLPIADVVQKSLTELTERVQHRRKGLMAGITTGLVDMNKHTGGWQPKDLIVIGARPGMGKTAAALHFVISAARQGTPVSVFSLEMGDSQLVDRLLVGESNVNKDAYKTGDISDTHLRAVESAAQQLVGLPVYIDDKPSISISYIRSRSRIMKRQGRCGMIVIDYLQLMDAEHTKGGNREQEVATISRGCKAIAKELEVPVILLAQLNRECEKRADKRPLLSDLRESGAIEQDADIVMFVHRPEQYGLECEYRGEPLRNGIEFIFAKFRNGSTGTIYAQHNDSITKFYDVNSTAITEDRFLMATDGRQEIMPF